MLGATLSSTFPTTRASGHPCSLDLMDKAAIQVENLGKRLRLGVGAGGCDTLLQVLARTVRPKKHAWREPLALRGVDMEVASGESLGIIGPDGAGKSTLLRILARIAVPTEASHGLAARSAHSSTSPPGLTRS